MHACRGEQSKRKEKIEHGSYKHIGTDMEQMQRRNNNKKNKGSKKAYLWSESEMETKTPGRKSKLRLEVLRSEERV